MGSLAHRDEGGPAVALPHQAGGALCGRLVAQYARHPDLERERRGTQEHRFERAGHRAGERLGNGGAGVELQQEVVVLEQPALGDREKAGEFLAVMPPGRLKGRKFPGFQLHPRLDKSLLKELIAAYRGRCALSGLPEPLLLDAAHIVADRNERLGQPVVQNGIPLSKIHHAAFDAHLIGIDPDYRVHVAERLLSGTGT